MECKTIYPTLYDLATLLYYTFGQDPNVWVLEPRCNEKNEYEITLCVMYKQQAEYIRSILPYTYKAFNHCVNIRVVVEDENIAYTCLRQKNQRDVATLFCNALKSNPLFRGVKLVPQSFLPIRSEIIVEVVEGCLPRSCGGLLHSGIQVADAFATVTQTNYGHLTQTEVIFQSKKNKCCHESCYYCIGDYRC